MTEEEIQEVYDDLESFSNALTDWERNFVESTFDQWFRKGRLTEKQQAKLKQVRDRVSNGRRFEEEI